MGSSLPALPGMSHGARSIEQVCFVPNARPSRLARLADKESLVRTDIVVGVDASRGSAAAFAWALDDASRRGLRVRAVLAWADKDRPAEVDAAAASPRLEDLAVAADTVLRRLVATARAAAGGIPGRPPGLNVPVDERTVYGRATHALLQESLSAGLLVLGSESSRVSQWASPGPIGDACAHEAPISLVVVPAEARATESRPHENQPVLVGVDGSPASAAAARWAATEATLRRVPLRVLQVADARSTPLARVPIRMAIPVIRPSSPLPGATIDTAVAMGVGSHGCGRLPVAVTSAHVPVDPVQLVKRIVTDLRAMPGAPPVERVALATGPAAARLLDAAEGAQLLVLGARGLGGFPTLSLGSTAHQCLARAACPTAIIRDRWY